MREPVLILSDLHLGHPASKVERAEQLRSVLEGSGTVVFNGDTFQELAREFRPRSKVLLKDLQSLCAELGAEVLLLPGNHDPGLEGQGWLELADGRVVITHGDAVMWGGSPWSRESLTRREKVRELWAQNEQADFDPMERLSLAKKISMVLRPPAPPKGRSFLRRVMDAINPPRRALEILRVWISQADRAAMFAERYFPKSEVLILGHFHWRGVWKKRGRLIMNTGAFVSPHRSMWVSYEGGLLKAGKVEGDNGAFSRGEVLSVWRV
jgi:predicted phosphodiesterase